MYGGDCRRPVKLSPVRPRERDKQDADYTGNANKDGYTRLAKAPAPGMPSEQIGVKRPEWPGFMGPFDD